MSSKGKDISHAIRRRLRIDLRICRVKYEEVVLLIDSQHHSIKKSLVSRSRGKN